MFVMTSSNSGVLMSPFGMGGLHEISKLVLYFTFKGPCIMKYMPIIVQQDATIYSLFISVNCATCFGWYLHTSSAAHVTVSTASGISKTVTVTYLEAHLVTFTKGCSYGFINARCCGYSDMSC